LEAEGLIVRAVSGRGQFIKLSDKGLKCLREFYVNLKKIFSEIPSSYNVRRSMRLQSPSQSEEKGEIKVN